MSNPIRILVLLFFLFESIITAQITDTLTANHYYEQGIHFTNNSLQEIKKGFDSSFTQTNLNKVLLDSADYYYQKAAAIYKNNKMWLKYIECIDRNSKNLLKLKLIDSALVLSRRGLNEIENNSPGLPLKFYNYYFRLGSYYYRYKLDFDSAIKYAKYSITLALNILPKTNRNIIIYYTMIGECYAFKHQFDSSMYYYNFILDSLISKNHQVNYPVDEIYHKISNSYKLQRDYPKAIEALQKAIDLRYQSRRYIGSYKNDLGNLYNSKGEYDKALECYFEAINLNLKMLGENHFDVATTYNNIGTIYLEKGDYNKSLEYLNKALYAKINTLGDTNPSLVVTYLNLSFNYFYLNDFQSALSCIQQVIKLSQISFSENDVRNFNIYCTAGFILSKSHNFDKAFSYINKCLEIIDKNKSYFDVDISTAEIYRILGTYYLEQNNYDTAIGYFNSALSKYKNFLGDHSPLVIKMNNIIGDIYTKERRFDKAVEYYNAALECNNANILSVDNDSSFSSVISEYDFFESLKGKSYALKNWYDKNNNLEILKAAYKTNLLCIDIFGKLRYSYKSDLSKIFLTETSYNIFDLFIGSAIKLSRLSGDNYFKEIAFDAAEKSKNGILQGTLTESKAKKYAGVPDSVLSIEDKLNKGIESYNILISQELEKEKPDSIKISYWQNNLFSLKEKFLKHISNLEQNYPKYHKLKFNTQCITVPEVQKAIDKETAVVEYFIGNNSIYIFTIRKEIFDITTVPKDSTFEETVNNLYKILLKQGNLIQKKNHDLFIKFNSYVYNCIIAPVFDKISASKNLVFIPDGNLYYIPFEILLEKPKQNYKFSEYNYLIKSHEISYNYSSTLCFGIDSVQEKHYKNLFTGFAPMFSDSTELAYINSYRKGHIERQSAPGYSNNGNLIFAKEEVKSIDRLFKQKGIPSDIYLDVNARKSRFEEIVSNTSSRYLHIATHGIANETRPNLSALLFSESPDDSNNNSGTLFAEEIFNMQINSELVVLSACESGIGKLIKGEGMMAINRSFMYSGVKKLLFSLWKVNDKETCKLMVEFYRNVLEGMPYKTALRKAKLKLLSNELSAIPSNWSAFILVD